MTVEALHPVLFVGAGPGDPELITVKGQKALQAADLVVWAGSLVPREVVDWTPAGCRVVDSAGLNLEQIVEHLVEGHRQGLRVVRLHTGDPSLYGAIWEQMLKLREAQVPYRVIPGVTAAFAAAAQLGLEYTIPQNTQTLILTRAAGRTPVPESEDLARLTATGASIAIYLSASQTAKVAAALGQGYGPDSAVAVVQKASWPQQRVLWTTPARLEADLREAGIDRLALILAGPGVQRVAPGADTDAPASELYNAAFSHGYRAAGD